MKLIKTRNFGSIKLLQVAATQIDDFEDRNLLSCDKKSHPTTYLTEI